MKKQLVEALPVQLTILNRLWTLGRPADASCSNCVSHSAASNSTNHALNAARFFGCLDHKMYSHGVQVASAQRPSLDGLPEDLRLGLQFSNVTQQLGMLV